MTQRDLNRLVDSVIDALEGQKTVGYLKWPIPHELDEKISRVVDRLADHPQMTEVLELLGDDHSDVLGCFAARMSMLAVREGSPERLRTGLVAAGIACKLTADIRERLMELPLLWRSAQLLGLDPKREFLNAALRTRAAGGDDLAVFARRKPRDQSLEVFWWVEIHDEEGFRYELHW